MYWRIEPYETNEYDACLMPADTESDHIRALEYAQDRLEEIWDQMTPGKSGHVTIELCEGEIPEEAE